MTGFISKGSAPQEATADQPTTEHHRQVETPATTLHGSYRQPEASCCSDRVAFPRPSVPSPEPLGARGPARLSPDEIERLDAAHSELRRYRRKRADRCPSSILASRADPTWIELLARTFRRFRSKVLSVPLRARLLVARSFPKTFGFLHSDPFWRPRAGRKPIRVAPKATKRQWFTAREIAAMNMKGLPTTERGVQSRATREEWPSRKRKGRGGGREYFLTAVKESARRGRP